LIYVVNGFVWTNSLHENQSVCLSLWVSIPPVIIESKEYGNILLPWKQKIVYFKDNRWTNNKGLVAHGELVNLARFELKLHNQIKRALASYFLVIAIKRSWVVWFTLSAHSWDYFYLADFKEQLSGIWQLGSEMFEQERIEWGIYICS